MGYDITRPVRDVNELEPEAKKGCLMLIEMCEKAGIPITIVETFRPQERQNYLYAQGRTRAGKVVTWTKSSFHTTRRAFDFIHKTLGYNAPESFWKRVADMAQNIGFTAGYYFKGQKDRPHIQLDRGKRITSANTVTSAPKGNNVSPDLKLKLKQMYGFNDVSIEYLANYKFGKALIEGMLVKKPLSDETLKYIKQYKYGEAMLQKIYNV